MEWNLLLNWSVLVDEAIKRRRGMNLTQKQLAALAKISTPTVSRFEQNAEDIQLSSALAILDTLGMTDKRTLIFTDPAYSYDMGMGVTFWGEDGKKRILCRISREALDDHFSEKDRLRPEAAFKQHRAEIEALARKKYLLGQTRPDGAVLIETQDLL